MDEGTIIRGVGGFYYVDTGTEVIECRARGKFRKENLKPYVGDFVELERSGDQGFITRIGDRKNLFPRPPVANVDQFIVVMALADPDPNFTVLDRFLTAAERNGVDVVICFTKADIAGNSIRKRAEDIYTDLYPLLFMDARNPEDIRDLVPYLFEKKSALAGPSGTGKSTILSKLRQDREILTGSVSDKTGRGRHTTRHVELFSLDFGGMVFDTPGFTSFDIPDLEPSELQDLYPDIERYSRGLCRFNGCLHVSEPGCRVQQAVQEGDIHEERYRSYVRELERIREQRKY